MEVLSSDKETRSVRFGCLLLTSVFAFILIVTVLPNLGSADTTDTPWVIVCGILFAYLIYSHARTYMRLVDAVFDCGDFLRIRKGDEQEDIPLSNIANVKTRYVIKMTRAITLVLAKPGKFGSEIYFCFPREGWGFSQPSMVDDLKNRARKARRNRK